MAGWESELLSCEGHNPPPDWGHLRELELGSEKRRLVVRQENGLPAAGGTEARQQEGLSANEQ